MGCMAVQSLVCQSLFRLDNWENNVIPGYPNELSVELSNMSQNTPHSQCPSPVLYNRVKWMRELHEFSSTGRDDRMVYFVQTWNVIVMLKGLINRMSATFKVTRWWSCESGEVFFHHPHNIRDEDSAVSVGQSCFLLFRGQSMSGGIISLGDLLFPSWLVEVVFWITITIDYNNYRHREGQGQTNN